MRKHKRLLGFRRRPSNKKQKQQPDLNSVFNQRSNNYLNELDLYVTTFNKIPNCIEEIEIDCRKANKWFYEEYEKDIKNHYFNKIYLSDKEVAEYDDIFYILYDDLIVNFDTNRSTCRLLFKHTDAQIIEAIVNGIKGFQHREDSRFSILTNSGFGLGTRALKVNIPQLAVADNYNDDFIEVHDTIIKRLAQDNDKGLVILHGKPGTGKTSYIRFLVSCLKKKVIFLSPNMAHAITDPGMISILFANPNTILVIEDAENVIVDREKEAKSPVSTLLNLTDGLLSDCLNIQVICSFNTDISKVDKALLRKGRLIAKYEFTELDIEKAQRLADKLGREMVIGEPMNLTDIYNHEDRAYQEKDGKGVIGFRTPQNLN